MNYDLDRLPKRICICYPISRTEISEDKAEKNLHKLLEIFAEKMLARKLDFQKTDNLHRPGGVRNYR